MTLMRTMKFRCTEGTFNIHTHTCIFRNMCIVFVSYMILLPSFVWKWLLGRINPSVFWSVLWWARFSSLRGGGGVQRVYVPGDASPY